MDPWRKSPSRCHVVLVTGNRASTSLAAIFSHQGAEATRVRMSIMFFHLGGV
jgi:hypothetical protein